MRRFPKRKKTKLKERVRPWMGSDEKVRGRKRNWINIEMNKDGKRWIKMNEEIDKYR